MILTGFTNYIKKPLIWINPIKAVIDNKEILKQLNQMDKTPNNQPTVMQTITPNTHNL